MHEPGAHVVRVVWENTRVTIQKCACVRETESAQAVDCPPTHGRLGEHGKPCDCAGSASLRGKQMIFSKGASANTLTQQSGKCGGQHPMRGGASDDSSTRSTRARFVDMPLWRGRLRSCEGSCLIVPRVQRLITQREFKCAERPSDARSASSAGSGVCAAVELCTNGQTRSALSLVRHARSPVSWEPRRYCGTRDGGEMALGVNATWSTTAQNAACT
jgi:hypothetical protein